MRDFSAISEISDVCEGCFFGKQQRQLIPFGDTRRAKKPLELVHTDVCGPMKALTPSQNKYLISFINVYTRIM